MKRPTLLLLPGLGLDSRVFAPQRELPFDVECLDWIEPESARESLPHYAQRMAARIRPRPGSYIGGISLGAMVALEAAPFLGAAGVLVIGGCSSFRQISPLFRAVVAIGARLPYSAIRPSLLLAPSALRLFERLPKDQSSLITRMLHEHSPNQLRWSCRALLNWECCAVPPIVPVHHIHGEIDEVIPLSNIQPQRIVMGGRHLINLTHHAAVNHFILQATAHCD